MYVLSSLLSVLLISNTISSSPVTSKLVQEKQKLIEDARSINPDTVIRPITNVMNRVQTSETVQVLDDLTQRFTNILGSMVVNVGDFVGETIKHLPNNINEISRTVNTAVSDGGEKVMVMVKGLQQEDSNSKSQILTKHDKPKPLLNTEVQESLQKLQDQVALTFGRIIAIVYKNADQVDTALASTLRQLTGLNGTKESKSSKSSSPDLGLRTGFVTSSSRTSGTKTGTLTDEEIEKLFHS